ncbi:mitochondrial fission 1 protein [Oryzias latipes]|uniref:Mitochondrial fission 1 protein n=1 Tax=Oryzias latipes TaxID=8090 RepID=H2LSD7_ORYLA
MVKYFGTGDVISCHVIQSGRPFSLFSGNMEAVLSDIVAPEDLLKFEKKYNSELDKGAVSKDTKFEYAWCLIRSKYSGDIQKGIALLEELVQKSPKDDSRDFLFYLAVANYRLKEYERALRYIRTLLKNEPENKQALEMEKLIDKALKKDGLVGMAIVGGIGLGVAGLAGLIGLAVSKGVAKS